MSNADLRRLDREIRTTSKKLEAVRRGELWPLNGRERRAMLRAAASGTYRTARGPQRRPCRDADGVHLFGRRDAADR